MIGFGEFSISTSTSARPGRLRRLAEFGDVGAGDEGAAAAGQHDGLNFASAIALFMHSKMPPRTRRSAHLRRTVDRDDGDGVMRSSFTTSFTGLSLDRLFLDCRSTCVE
jgi:hypothetical protein